MQDQRLEYVCRLVRRAGQPYCPINGILTLLPYGMIYRSEPDSSEIHRAVSKNLGTIRQRAQGALPGDRRRGRAGRKTRIPRVNAPRQAARRACGSESGTRSRSQIRRYPNGSKPWQSMPAGRSKTVSTACSARRNALQKPGNSRLFALLCTIRRRILQNRLGKILKQGYASDFDPHAPPGGLLFGGCYFAATGAGEDRRAFIKAVVDKLLEQQEELEWTPEMLREDARCQLFAQLALVFDTLLLAGLIGVVMYRIWWK